MTTASRGAQISALLASNGPLEQSLLVDVSRKSLKPYLQDEENVPSLSDVELIWHRLVQSNSCTDGNEKYLTAVCNAVSVLLLALSTTQDSRLRSFVFSEEVWQQGLSCALIAFANGKTKPALQVMDALCNLISLNEDTDKSLQLLEGIARDQGASLVDGASHQRTKTACIVLSCFIKRTSLQHRILDLFTSIASEHQSAWRKYLRAHNLSNAGLRGSSEGSSAFYLATLMAANALETRSAATKLMSLSLTRGLDNPDQHRRLELAADALGLYLRQNPDRLGEFADNVLSAVLIDKKLWLSCVDVVRGESCKKSISVVSLAVLRAGKMKSYFNDDDLLEASMWPHGDQNGPLAGTVVFQNLFRAADPVIRIQAYELLTCSPTTTTRVLTDVLTTVGHSLKYLHNENDSHERGQLLSISRRLLKRIDTQFQLHTITNGSTKAESALWSFPESYTAFLQKLLRVLQTELSPGISYPRHILALHVIRMLLDLKSSVVCDFNSIYLSVVNLVLDTFEDVRSAATEICKNLLLRTGDSALSRVLETASISAQHLAARTSRHDHADGAGRLLHLASEQNSCAILEGSLKVLGNHLEHITSMAQILSMPIHALLRAATHMLDSQILSDGKTQPAEADWTQIKVLKTCQRIWLLVQDVLCVDSPETATTEEDNTASGPKDLLSFSWRALRDSSLLLQALLRSLEASFTTLDTAGSLCILQLSMLRHRGAFSTVSQTFDLCCAVARKSHDQKIRSLNPKWYRDACEQIHKQSDKLTRRSAGLPSLICAVLDSQDSVFFDEVMHDLLAIAGRSVIESNAQDRLPQVHALNCLKDILNHSRLRSQSERYQQRLLKLGAVSLSSELWPVRNAGLMLLRACMLRFQTADPDKGYRTIESRDITSPGQIAVDLLEMTADCTTNTSQYPEISGQEITPYQGSLIPRPEIIFAALDLIKNADFSVLRISRLAELVRTQLASTIWAIRDHAAKVLAGLATTAHESFELLALVPLHPNQSSNALHGILLLHRYCHESIQEGGNEEEIEESFSKVGDSVESSAAHLCVESSPYTKAALLDIANDALSHILRTGRHLSDLMVALTSIYHLCVSNDNAYLRARWLMTQCLCYIAEGTELTSRKFGLIGDEALSDLVSRMDATVSEYVVPRLKELQPLDRIARWRLIYFWSRLLSSGNLEHHEFLHAMSATASVLEADFGLLFHFYLLPEAVAHRNRILTKLRIEAATTREYHNASLHLLGAMAHPDPDHSSDTTEVVSNLLTRIDWAARDDTDFYARLNAAISMRMLTSFFISTGSAFWSFLGSNFLTYMVILYDQINDDDEEVRDIAQQSLALYIKHNEKRQEERTSATLHASASSEILIDMMVALDLDTQSGSGPVPNLSAIAVSHILGKRTACTRRAGTEFAFLLKGSVGQNLEGIIQSLDVLFAEERQNLFIDEFKEVERWTKVLEFRGMNLKSDSESTLLDWVTEGLEAIIQFLKDCKHDMFPVGPTYHEHILLLLVRVISLATAMRKHDLNPALKRTYEVCIKQEVHPRIIEAFGAQVDFAGQ